MKKTTIISTSTILALSALIPVTGVAAENDVPSENAMPGFYNVKTGEVLSIKMFRQVDNAKKKKIFTNPSFYFADGKGNALPAQAVITATNKELKELTAKQTTIETQFNVRFTADGRVIFLSLEDAFNALTDAINQAKEEAKNLTGSQKEKVENAIAAAEEVLNTPNVTLEQLQGALGALKAALQVSKDDVSSALQEAIDQAKAQLDKLTQEQQQAVQQAIQAAEEALNKANATIEELQKALEELQNALPDQKPTESEIRDAINKAQQTKDPADINKAQDLVNGLKDGPLKEELQGLLDAVKNQVKEEASTALDNAIKDAQDKLEQILQENQQAVKDAIQAAEDALANANATIEDLQNALKQLEEALKNAGTETPVDPAIKAAQDAVAQAQDSKKQEDIDRAQNLVNQLEDGKIKDDLQAILDQIVPDSNPTKTIANSKATLGLIGTSVVSSNDAVVTAAIEGNNIVLTSVAPGTAAVTVSDKDGNKATVNVTIGADKAITVNSIDVYKPSKQALQEEVDAANTYKESYFTPATWGPFSTALAEAKAELNRTNSTQTSLANALSKLTNAMANLMYQTIPYTIGDTVTASQITLTFTEAVDTNGSIDNVGGTLANATVTVSNNGKVLSISSPADAKKDDTVEFTLTVGGKPVAAVMKWNGNDWRLSTNPEGVFLSTIKVNVTEVVELQLLSEDGQLIDGQVSLDQLLNNPNLLRLNLLPGSGLVAGDVLKLAAPGFNLLNIELTEEDLSRGFVDAGVSTELLDTLTGGENLDLSVIVTRDLTNVLEGAVGALPLPDFLTKPVVNAVDELTNNIVNILKGEQTFKVDLPTVGKDKVEAGDTIKFKLRRPGIKLQLLPAIGEATTETESVIITPDDIARGYADATFANQNLVNSLLGGVGNLLGSLTGGTSVYITPVVTKDGVEVVGDEIEVKLSNGLIRSLLGL